MNVCASCITVFAPDAFVVRRRSVSCRAIPYTDFARRSSVIAAAQNVAANPAFLAMILAVMNADVGEDSTKENVPSTDGTFLGQPEVGFTLTRHEYRVVQASISP